MKANRRPQNAAVASQSFSFVHRAPQNILKVESGPGRVRIRASRDNFSERDKEFFVRHLADEGFIPDHFRWAGFGENCRSSAVQWEVEFEPQTDGKTAPRPGTAANAFMRRLLAGALVLWLIELATLFLFSK
jgi:hypothetical protein